MGPAQKKRRLNETVVNGHAPEKPSKKRADFCPVTPATVEEKMKWPGFCEIESEPAFFNVMLKDFGVKGVKVQEVFGLEEELLAMLPQPVYGLIFLYRYRSDDINNQEATCPDNVWFANQISDFSCATVSLLNIINNIPHIVLGDQLQSFKDFTKDFPPSLRGDAIANFEFVKQIHNSFARKMDMLNIDLGLQNSHDDRRKPKPLPAKESTPKKNNSKKKKPVITDNDYADNNGAFHFSAYVPIDGEVFKLDGLDRQPQRLGKFESGSDWLSVITPIISTQMAAYEIGDIEFGLLSLVRDPLIMHRANLARNIKSLRAVHARLGVVNSGWREFLPGGGSADGEVITGADVYLDVSERDIEEAALESLATELHEEECPVRLLETRQKLVNTQRSLRSMMVEEMSSAAEDERRAKDRRNDYGPFIYTWLKMLAEKEGLMKELVDAVR